MSEFPKRGMKEAGDSRFYVEGSNDFGREFESDFLRPRYADLSYRDTRE
jgi:hypothetical protein